MGTSRSRVGTPARRRSQLRTRTRSSTRGSATSIWGAPTWKRARSRRPIRSSIAASRAAAKRCRCSSTRSPPTATSRRCTTTRAASGKASRMRGSPSRTASISASAASRRKIRLSRTSAAARAGDEEPKAADRLRTNFSLCHDQFSSMSASVKFVRNVALPDAFPSTSLARSSVRPATELGPTHGKACHLQVCRTRTGNQPAGSTRPDRLPSTRPVPATATPVKFVSATNALHAL